MLTASRLSCIRGDRTLFNGLDVALFPGEVLLVSGANGSGKTSLLKILSGLMLPDEGEVFWGNRNICQSDTGFSQGLLYLGHANGVKLDLTPTENLQFYAKLGARISQVSHETALDKAGLAGFERELTRTLSAGQRRRVALARLFMTDCSLWILDEPFTSIDRQTIARLMDAMQQHLLEGGMLMLTSHHALDFNGYRVRRLELSA